MNRTILIKSSLVIFILVVIQRVFASGLQDPTVAIHQEVIAGNIDALKDLLSLGEKVVDINAKNGLGWTPLHTAIRNNQKAVVELLLENGADVNAQDRNGQTPLHFAVESGQKDTVATLISKGANINAADNNGETPFILASLAGQTVIADTLLNTSIAQSSDQSSEASAQSGPMNRGEFSGRGRGNRSGGQPRGPEQLSGEEFGQRMSRGDFSGRGTVRGRGGENPFQQPITSPEQMPQQNIQPDSLLEPGNPAGPGDLQNEQTNLQQIENILADPNEIIARVKTFEGLEKAIEQVTLQSQLVTRQWRLTGNDNRSPIVRGLQRQLNSEYEFLAAIAKNEKAAQTVQAIEAFQAEKTKMGRTILSELANQEQEARVTRTTTSTRMRTSLRSTRRTAPQSTITQQSEIDTMQQGETIEQQDPEVTLWLNADVQDFDSRINLAQEVNSQIHTEFASIRAVALEENAGKTVAAVDGLLLARQERYDEVYELIEQLKLKQEQAQTQGGTRRTMMGVTTGQDGMEQNYMEQGVYQNQPGRGQRGR